MAAEAGCTEVQPWRCIRRALVLKRRRWVYGGVERERLITSICPASCLPLHAIDTYRMPSTFVGMPGCCHQQGALDVCCPIGSRLVETASIERVATQRSDCTLRKWTRKGDVYRELLFDSECVVILPALMKEQACDG